MVLPEDVISVILSFLSTEDLLRIQTGPRNKVWLASFFARDVNYFRTGSPLFCPPASICAASRCDMDLTCESALSDLFEDIQLFPLVNDDSRIFCSSLGHPVHSRWESYYASPHCVVLDLGIPRLLSRFHIFSLGTQPSVSFSCSEHFAGRRTQWRHLVSVPCTSEVSPEQSALLVDEYGRVHSVTDADLCSDTGAAPVILPPTYADQCNEDPSAASSLAENISVEAVLVARDPLVVPLPRPVRTRFVRVELRDVQSDEDGRHRVLGGLVGIKVDASPKLPLVVCAVSVLERATLASHAMNSSSAVVFVTR